MELFRLIAWLLRRPRRSERRLPIIWLIRSAGHDEGRDAEHDVLVPVQECLTRPPRRQVPHVTLDAPRFADGAYVRPVLDELHHQLALDAFGAPPLVFRHYPLACWLMDQTLPRVDVGDRRAWLAERLRERRWRGSDAGAAAGGAETLFAVVYRFLVWLVRRAAPGVLFRAAVSGRVPLVGRPYRWFMQQHYLAPRQSVTFVGFAERLTAGRRAGEQPGQVSKLLVHAFLEDLRCAYARPPWRLAGWRRTAYPVLLLRDVAPDNGGYTLVRLINDVRNETGRSDPLLVIASGDAATMAAIGAGPPGYDVANARRAYEHWLAALPEQRRLRRPDAWHLPLAADKTTDAEQQRSAVAEFTVPPPPPWARRGVAAATVLVLLAGAALLALTRYGPGCWPQPLRGPVSVRLVDGQCVGYSGSAAHVFSGDQQKLRAIQERIFGQNKRATELWERSGRRRPMMTLAYLGDLTGKNPARREVAYVSEREELEGMAVAQHAQLQHTSSTYGQPLLRIVVANGGKQMEHIDQTVEMLTELIRDDPTLVGVLGLVDSRTTTADALRRLNEIGLPVIAPNLSADGMYRNSRLYLQMVAANTDQAKLVSEYAAKVLRVTEAHVYYTTGDSSRLKDDLYVTTLLEAMSQRFGGRMEVKPFRTGDSLRRECGYRGLLFFAGRYSEFDEFLSALALCRDDPPRHLVADDSVNRYLANHQARVTAPGNLPVTYVSKAALAMCSRLAAPDATDEAHRFLDLIGQHSLLPDRRCADGGHPPVGERVALAYDATTMLILAMARLVARLTVNDQPVAPEAISPVAVYTEVLAQNAAAPFPGVAGPVRFNIDTPGEPVEKRISLMRVPSIPVVTEEPQEIYSCGIARVGDPPGCHPR